MCFDRNCASNVLTYVESFMIETTWLIIELSYVLEYRPVILYSWMVVKSGLLYTAYVIALPGYVLWYSL